MSRLKYVAALAVAAALSAGPGRADEKSHRQAVDELFKAMQMDKTMDQVIDQMLEMQIKANPALEQVRDPMRKFFAKYLSFGSMKEEMTRIYAEEFTEAEVKEMTAFYKTPTGKKTIEKTPLLTRKGGELGMKRVQENQAELQKMIQDALSGKKDN
jgi:hypothetical protein